MKRLIDPTPLATKNGTKNAKKPDCFTHRSSIPSTAHWAKSALWFPFFTVIDFFSILHQSMIYRELKCPCIHRIGKYHKNLFDSRIITISWIEWTKWMNWECFLLAFGWEWRISKMSGPGLSSWKHRIFAQCERRPTPCALVGHLVE